MVLIRLDLDTIPHSVILGCFLFVWLSSLHAHSWEDVLYMSGLSAWRLFPVLLPSPSNLPSSFPKRSR